MFLNIVIIIYFYLHIFDINNKGIFGLNYDVILNYIKLVGEDRFILQI